MNQAVHSTSGLTVERYLLGELSADERDQFENHFFSCQECAEQVLAGATFLDNARAVLPEMDRAPAAQRLKERETSRGWFGWAWAPQAAFACILLLGAITAYQNTVEIPHLRAHAGNGELTLTGAQVLTARRAASNLVFRTNAGTASVIVANEWEENFLKYSSEIQKDTETKAVLASPPVAASGAVAVSIPVARLGAGKYTIILYGVTESGAKQVVARHPFTIED